jgi:hypothetical protein
VIMTTADDDAAKAVLDAGDTFISRASHPGRGRRQARWHGAPVPRSGDAGVNILRPPVPWSLGRSRHVHVRGRRARGTARPILERKG